MRFTLRCWAYTLACAALSLGCGADASPSAPQSPGTTSEAQASSAQVAADPVCAEALANVALQGPLPEGVTLDPRSREEVLAASASFQLPEEVTFTIDPTLTVDADGVTVRGTLRNTGDTAQVVMLSEAGAGFFNATLVGEGLVRLPTGQSEGGGPPRPALFPEPRAFVLAPGAVWPLQSVVRHTCWARPSGPVAVHWWLAISGAGLDGELPLTLP